jgi:hypothetical protein
MAIDRATVEVEHAGMTVVLEVGVLAVIGTAPAPVSSAAPSPWAAHGFAWHDIWGLLHVARRQFVAQVVGQEVTIWKNLDSEPEVLTAPDGSDPRLFAWNAICERSWHDRTPADIFPEVSL